MVGAINGMTTAGRELAAAGDRVADGAQAMAAGAAAMTEAAHGMTVMVAEVRDAVRRIEATCEETRDMVAELGSGVAQLLAMARAQSRSKKGGSLRLAFWRRGEVDRG